MSSANTRVCPVGQAGTLDNRLRRWLQHPLKILSPYVRSGMTVLDYGCGPGFFTIDLARLVGPSGRVIAADLQSGMLEKLKRKIQGTELADRIRLHACEAERIGVAETVDFVLAFYVVHEIPRQDAFFRELAVIVRSGGRVLMVEPPLHVSKAAFKATLATAGNAGFIAEAGPRVLLSKSVLLRKA